MKTELTTLLNLFIYWGLLGKGFLSDFIPDRKEVFFIDKIGVNINLNTGRRKKKEKESFFGKKHIVVTKSTVQTLLVQRNEQIRSF